MCYNIGIKIKEAFKPLQHQETTIQDDLMDTNRLPLLLGAVFDMDGLMFDTEKMFLHVWVQAGKEWGLGDIFDIGCKSLGVNAVESERLMRGSSGLPCGYGQLFGLLSPNAYGIQKFSPCSRKTRPL